MRNLLSIGLLGLFGGSIIVFLYINVGGIWKTGVQIDTTTGDYKVSSAISNPGPVGKSLVALIEKNKSTDAWELKIKSASFVKLGRLTCASDSAGNPETKLTYISQEIPVGKNITLGGAILEKRNARPVNIANEELQILNKYYRQITPTFKEVRKTQKSTLYIPPPASFISPAPSVAAALQSANRELPTAQKFEKSSFQLAPCVDEIGR